MRHAMCVDYEIDDLAAFVITSYSLIVDGGIGLQIVRECDL